MYLAKVAIACLATFLACQATYAVGLQPPIQSPADLEASPNILSPAPLVDTESITGPSDSDWLSPDEEEPQNVTFSYDVSALPEAVRALRQRLLDVARSGNLEAMRPIFESNLIVPVLGYDLTDDPVAYLRENSNDGLGRETLAILIELLETGYAHVDAGTEEERFVWPYFAETPIDSLTVPQLVELYRLVSHQDVEEMRMFGAYFFFRIGIDREGTLLYFVAGD